MVDRPDGQRARQSWTPGALVAQVTAVVTVLIVWRGSYDPFVAPKLAVATAGAAVALALAVAGRRLVAVPRRLFVLAGVVAAVWLVATVAGPVWGPALMGPPGRGTGLVAVLAGLALLIASASGRLRDARAWCIALAMTGGVQGLVVLAQFAGLDPFEWTRTSDLLGTQGNENFVAATCAIGAVPALVATLRWRSPWASAAALAAASALGGVAVAGAVQGWAAVAAGSITVAAASVWHRWPRRARRGLLVAGGLLVAAGVVSLAVSEHPNVVERREQWAVATAVVADHPVLGAGPVGYSLVYTAERSAEAAARTPSLVADDPHSVPLNVAAATGVLGLVAFAALHLATASRWLRAVRAGPPGLVLLALGGAWVAWWVQALVSIDHPGLMVMGAVTTGAIWAVTGPATSVTDRPGKHLRRASAWAALHPAERVGLVTASAAMAAATAAAGLNLVASHHLQRAEAARFQPLEPEQVFDHLGSASDWWPHDHRVPVMEAAVALRTDAFGRAAEAAADAARLGPGRPEASGYAAIAHGAAGDEAAADRWRRRWLAEDPHNPVILATVARAASTGEGEARRLLADAADPSPETAAAWLAIGDAHAALGEEETALEAYEQALRTRIRGSIVRRRLAGVSDPRALLPPP